MNPCSVCLRSIRGKIFKLLPMRESFDRGEDNHLEDYVENLSIAFSGAIINFQNLGLDKDVLDAFNIISGLRGIAQMPYKQVRSAILRSVRILTSAIDRIESKDGDCLV